SDLIAARVLQLGLSVVLATAFASAALTVHDTKSLLRACGAVSVVYLVVAPGYWSWYVVLPVALLALAPRGLPALMILIMSLGARLAASIDALRIHGAMSWPTEVIAATVVGIWLPALAVITVGGWRWYRLLTDRPEVLIRPAIFRPSYHR